MSKLTKTVRVYAWVVEYDDAWLACEMKREHLSGDEVPAMLVPLAEYRRLKKTERAVRETLNLSQIHLSLAGRYKLVSAFCKPAKKSTK